MSYAPECASSHALVTDSIGMGFFSVGEAILMIQTGP